MATAVADSSVETPGTLAATRVPSDMDDNDDDDQTNSGKSNHHQPHHSNNNTDLGPNGVEAGQQQEQQQQQQEEGEEEDFVTSVMASVNSLTLLEATDAPSSPHSSPTTSPTGSLKKTRDRDKEKSHKSSGSSSSLSDDPAAAPSESSSHKKKTKKKSARHSLKTQTEETAVGDADDSSSDDERETRSAADGKTTAAKAEPTTTGAPTTTPSTAAASAPAPSSSTASSPERATESTGTTGSGAASSIEQADGLERPSSLDGEDDNEKRGPITSLIKRASWSGSLRRAEKKGLSLSTEAVSGESSSGEPTPTPDSLSKRISRQLLVNLNRIRGGSRTASLSNLKKDAGRSTPPADGSHDATASASSSSEPQPGLTRSNSLPDLTDGTGPTLESLTNKALVSILKKPAPKADPVRKALTLRSRKPIAQPPKVLQHVKFNEVVTVRRTWAKKDYDRKGEVTWKLTPEKAADIRNELNEFKREMDIHEDSKTNTHFY